MANMDVRLMMLGVGTVPPTRVGLTTRASASRFSVVLWLLCLCVRTVQCAPCPVCKGNFASCDFATTGSCITSGVVGANVASVQSGKGALTLTGIVNPKWLRMFQRTELSSLMSLITRSTPGTAFELKKDTKMTKIVNAIQTGQTTLEVVVTSLMGMMDELDPDDASEKKERDAIKERLEGLKILSQGKGLVAVSAVSSVNMGIYTFMFYRVSEFVMTSTETFRFWSRALAPNHLQVRMGTVRLCRLRCIAPSAWRISWR